jgi:hypothetical protein
MSHGAGNRTSTQQGSNQAVPYTTNNVNQYAQVGNLNLSYDGQHNLTRYNGTAFTYDWSRRLFSATTGPTDVESRYDGLGRCVSRSINGAVTYITYDG